MYFVLSFSEGDGGVGSLGWLRPSHMVDCRDGERVNRVGLQLNHGVTCHDRAVGVNLLVQVPEIGILVFLDAAPSVVKQTK